MKMMMSEMKMVMTTTMMKTMMMMMMRSMMSKIMNKNDYNNISIIHAALLIACNTSIVYFTIILFNSSAFFVSVLPGVLCTCICIQGNV